MKVGE
jgi:hypothetical protein